MTGSVLTRLGWDVDKEDRDVGWIVTDSRRLDDDNKTGDRSVEKRILDRIGRSL